MSGGLYTRQKCPICHGKMIHDERRRGCFCPEHGIPATRFYVKYKTTFKNFKTYEEAARFLNMIRYTLDHDTYDPDDHRKDAPNSFSNLAELYLTRKKTRKSFTHIERYIQRAMEYFKHRNVKDITGAHIDDFVYSLKDITEKTRYNYCSQLHDMFSWIVQRGVIQIAPVFPRVEYELGRRKITDWETQGIILDKIKEISAHVSEKIWLGCDMLAKYTALRPDDLRRVHEDSLDHQGYLTIHNPTKKKNRFKVIRLLPHHIEEWKRLQKKYPAMPSMPFFRHRPGARGATAESLFGHKLFHKWWENACKELGIDGVSLYPGTKHTTATETAKLLGSDRARAASGLTNKAFDRYCQIENSGAFEIVSAAFEEMAIKQGKVIPMNKVAK